MWIRLGGAAKAGFEQPETQNLKLNNHTCPRDSGFRKTTEVPQATSRPRISFGGTDRAAPVGRETSETAGTRGCTPRGGRRGATLLEMRKSGRNGALRDLCG